MSKKYTKKEWAEAAKNANIPTEDEYTKGYNDAWKWFRDDMLSQNKDYVLGWIHAMLDRVDEGV